MLVRHFISRYNKRKDIRPQRSRRRADLCFPTDGLQTESLPSADDFRKNIHRIFWREKKMELRVLRYFLAVAREENISAAAHSLNITQPTLSRQIMELEEELGVKLLDRGKKNRKITLTEEGMLLRKRAKEIVLLTDKAKSELTSKHDVISGDIYIGGGETDAMRLIAKTARKLQKEYPHIHYHLYSGNADDVTERLDKGLLDFGILIEPADIKKYDYIQLPAAVTWGLLMRKDHPLAKKTSILPKDLNGLPVLTSNQTMVHNEISGWFGRNCESLNITATYNLIYNATLMVDEGVGCALCIDGLVNTGEESSLCFRPLKPRLEARLDLVWKKSQLFSGAARKFLEELRRNIHSS